MTVAGSVAPSASCTLPPPVPSSTPDGALPSSVASGGGPTELAAAIEQVRVAVDQLAQAVNALAAGAPPVSGGGDTGAAGCGMSGCGAGSPAPTTGGGASAAPTAPAPAAAVAAPAPASAPAPAPAPGLSPSDAELARRIDAQVFQGTGLAGKGAVLVEAARRYSIPIDFALAIYQKEASFARPGTLADRNNNPGNLRFAEWQREHGGAPNGGFTKYPTMDDGIRASMHLLSMGRYKDAVARRDWGAVISIYAPSSENDTSLYIRQMNDYTASFRRKLGIGEDWLRT